MNSRDEELMLSGIHEYKLEMSGAEKRTEKDFCAYRDAVRSLRTSLDELESELIERAKPLLQLRAMDAVMGDVSRAWGISPELIMQKRQSHVSVAPRQVAMFLMSESGNTMADIGRYFGKHHTTVVHAVRVVRGKIASDVVMAEKVNAARRLGV